MYTKRTTRSSSSPSKLDTRAPWKKILYIQQPYPDNYTDKSFLQLLKKNENVRRYSYPSLVYQATMTITLHFSCLCIFMVTFLNLNEEIWSAPVVLALVFLLAISGFTAWFAIMSRSIPGFTLQRRIFFKSGLLLSLMLFGLAPLLKNLTRAISPDSIWALTVGALTVNALFHDYSSAIYTRIVFPGSVSTNAAIFASVLLASRLDNTLQAATLLFCATVWFALLPIFQRHLRHFAPNICFLKSIFVINLAFGMIVFYVHSSAWSIAYLSTILIITLMCPAALIYARRYKNEISGPWDEAKPQLGATNS